MEVGCDWMIGEHFTKIGGWNLLELCHLHFEISLSSSVEYEHQWGEFAKLGLGFDN